MSKYTLYSIFCAVQCGVPATVLADFGTDMNPSNEHTSVAASTPVAADRDDCAAQATEVPVRPREIGGRDGPDPTRYGDWEKSGRCIDF